MANFLKRLFRGSKDPEPSVEQQPSPAPVAPAAPGKIENHQVNSVKDFSEAIMTLAAPNPEYQKTQAALQREGCIWTTVFEYKWPLCEATLVPEPENPRNPKAIKVLANGRHIGYMKDGSCARIHKLIQAGKIAYATCEIGGGNGKILIPDDSSDKERYVLKPDKKVLWAKVNIHLKPEN